MTTPRLPEHRRPSLIDVNLAPTAPTAWRAPISLLSFTLVILVLVAGYALFPFGLLGQWYDLPKLPNVYQLWQQQQDDVANLEMTLAARQAQLAYLMGQASYALALRDQIDELESLLGAMEGDHLVLSAGAVTWSELLRRIDLAARPWVTLTSIAQGSQLEVEGFADSTDNVSHFAAALRNTELFSEVVISEMTCVPPPTPTPMATPPPTPTPTPVAGRCSFLITATLLQGGSQ